MNRQQIFNRLWKMRQRMKLDQEVDNLDDEYNCMLYDVAKELGMTERQAQLLAGDIQPDEPTRKINE